MNEEDKALLIKDLCARLPYGVKVKSLLDGSPILLTGFDGSAEKLTYKHFYDEMDGEWKVTERLKPFLFPMSSMTDEQRKEIRNKCNIGLLFDDIFPKAYSVVPFLDVIKYFNWLNAHHFDYNGLIDKGLAIDATNLNIY